MSKVNLVKSLVLTGYGINCEKETAECFKRAGSEATVLHINELVKAPEQLHSYHILAIPGGFSYGDHIASGKIFANKLKLFLHSEISRFISEGKGVIGICNGFQVLVKAGILPNFDGFEASSSNIEQGDKQDNKEGDWSQQVSITYNEHGRFEDRWVKLKVNTQNKSFWLHGVGDTAEKWDDFQLPIRHGEGRFVVDSTDKLEKLLSSNLHAFSYQNDLGEVTLDYPMNPNGSMAGVAGITNVTGNVLGLMPHPEAYMFFEQSPNFQDILRRNGGDKIKTVVREGMGMKLFRNGVEAMQKKI